MAGMTGLQRLPVFEITMGERPAGMISLHTDSTLAGSLAEVTVEAVGADRSTATVSVTTFSPTGAGNATTVHALSIGPDGPILAAATTGGNVLQDGADTSAYAVIAGPSGAVFRATGDLSGLQVRTAAASLRREGRQGPVHSWDLPQGGQTEFALFVGPVSRTISETYAEGVSIDLAETAGAAELPGIAFRQTQRLRARGHGVQAGIVMNRRLDRTLSVWTRLGLGITRIRAESALHNQASVGQASIWQTAPAGSVSRTGPSLSMSVGITQAFDAHSDLSLFVQAEADRSPTLAPARDGGSGIAFVSTRDVAFGLNLTLRF